MEETPPDKEVVSVYQEHTALAASSVSVVVPLIRSAAASAREAPGWARPRSFHGPVSGPEPHQLPVPPGPAVFSCSSRLVPPRLHTKNHVSRPESEPRGLCLFPFMQPQQKLPSSPRTPSQQNQPQLLKTAWPLSPAASSTPNNLLPRAFGQDNKT